MDADYIKDGIKYTRISRISGKLGKSTDAVTEAVKRLGLERLVIKIGQKEVSVVPPHTIAKLKRYYAELAEKRPKKVNYPKDMNHVECVPQCKGCCQKKDDKCRISIDPEYQWKYGECWIRKLWEG